jgi:hypothetical protein
MGKELIIAYAKMLEEITSSSLRRGMAEFLAEPGRTKEKLGVELVDYIARFNNHYVRQPQDRWLDGIWDFKRRGTLRSPMSDDEIVEMCRKDKEKIYL